MTEETISWSKLKFLVSNTESRFGVTASEIVLSEKCTIRYQKEKINQQRTRKAKPFTWCFCFVLFMDLGTDYLRLWDVSCTHPNSVRLLFSNFCKCAAVLSLFLPRRSQRTYFKPGFFIKEKKRPAQKRTIVTTRKFDVQSGYKGEKKERKINSKEVLFWKGFSR